MKHRTQTLISAMAGLVLSGGAFAQTTPPTPEAAPGTASVPKPASAAPAPASTVPATKADYLPEPFNANEHSGTWENPPFSRRVLPPAVEGPVDAGPLPWDGWQIAAVDKFNGTFNVGLVTKKNEFRLFKEGQMHEDEGVRVTKVESTGVISETIVHLSDGSRTGTITFESKRLTAAPKGAPAAKPTKGVAAPRRTVQPAATPQQRAAQAAAQKQAQATMAKHLNEAATKTAAQPAAPQPTTRTRRRSVVLPPSK